MAWEARGSRPYYYRSVRHGKKVHKVYLGSKDVAKQAADEDAVAKAKRAADDAVLTQLQATVSGADQIAAEAQHGVEVLAEATLLALGFHEHRGQWRWRRD